MEQEGVFPKLSIFPGTRIKVVKKEMTPPERENEISELIMAGNGRAGGKRVYSNDPSEIIIATNKNTGRTYASMTRSSRPSDLELHGDGVLYWGGIDYGYFTGNTPVNFIFKRLKNW